MLFTSFIKNLNGIYRFIYILVLLTVLPLFAQHQAFWVSTTGNDTLAGNQANPFATITHALSVIADQDTIRIEPGYYYEQLDISGLVGVYDFVMQGASLMDTIGIISPNPGPVISIGMPLSNQTQFLNLFISHENPDSLGPGFEIFSSNPIIENCIIAGNHDNSPGGGIRIYSSGSVEAPVIRECHIHDNTAMGGGGIFAQASSVIIKHSIIEFNDALGFEGGGIFLQGCSGSTIADNQVHVNRGNDGAGIYIDVDDTNPVSNTITNNLIFRNDGLNAGAGMYIRGSSTTNTITDNTFGENFAQGSGGGLFVEMAANIVLNRNLFVNNNSMQNGGGICFSDMTTSSIDLWSNHISGNKASGEGGGVYLINCNNLTVGSAVSLHNNFYHNRAGGVQNAIASGTGITTLNLSNNYWGFPEISAVQLQINIPGSNLSGLVFELKPFDLSIPLVEGRSLYYFGDGFIEFRPEAMTVTGSEYLGVKTTIDTVLSAVNDLNFLGKKYKIDFTGIDVFYPVDLFLYYDQSELDNAGNPPIEDLLITYFDGSMTEWYTAPSTYDNARQLIMANFSTFENSEFSIGFYRTMSDSMFEVHPEPNRTDIDAESTVDILFKRAVDESTLIPENISIFGQYSGFHSYHQKYDAANYHLKLIPDQPFVYGEEVTVTITANIFDMESVPFSKGFTWKYDIGAFLGNTQFSPGQVSPVRLDPIKHQLADMNEDHFPDLVELSMTQMTILTNDRLGNFIPFDSLSLAQQYRLMDVNDFNMNNIPDIVIVNQTDLTIYEYNHTSHQFVLLHNESLSLGGPVIDMVVEDFNNDAISDIFLLYDNGSNYVANAFIADTSDGFYLITHTPNNLPGYPNKIIPSDINNDGFLDILGNSGTSSNDLTLLINQAGSSFSRIISSTMDVNYTTAIQAANIWNGYPYDMQREVIITGEQIGTYYPIVSIMNANPVGTLNILHNEVLPDYTVDMVVSDLTSDGFIDVLICNGDSTIQILQNDGNSYQLLPILADDIGANELMAADLDLDGDMDILAFEKTTITAQWQVLRNTTRTNRTFYVDNTVPGGTGDLSSPFQHIGDALVRSIDGDSIIVNGGGSAYFEHLYIDKNLTLTSMDDRPVFMQSMAKSNLDSAMIAIENTQRVKIENFIIHQDSLIDGAVPNNFIFGIRAENTDSLIMRNINIRGMTIGMDLNNISAVFNHGYLERNGFGIKAQNSNLNISHLDVERSRLGGMKINATDAVMDEVDFHHNAFDAIQYEGGIIAENNSFLKLRFYEISQNGLANVILRNSTGDIKYGGIFDAFVNEASDAGAGVYVMDGSTLYIGNTVIGGNYRHGIYALNSDVNIQNNIIGKNDSLSAVSGSGIYIDGGNARVVNNIIGMNNGGIWIDNATMVVDYNDFFENTNDFPYGISEVLHNLFEYPLFVSDYLVFGGHYTQSDPGFDPWQFKLAPGSPLIDRGDPSIFNGDGSISDMGMFGDVDTTFVLNYRPAPMIMAGDSSITISWSTADVAMDTLFRATVIFRSTQQNFIPDTTQLIALLDNHISEYVDYNVGYGQIYYYKLAFVDMYGGVAGYSEEINGRLDFYEFNFNRRQEFAQLGQGDSLQRALWVHNTGTLPINIQIQNYAGLPSWLNVLPSSVIVPVADSADFTLNFSSVNMPRDTLVRHTLNFVTPDYEILIDSVIVRMLVSYRDLFPPQTELVGTYPDTVRESLLRFQFRGNDQVYTTVGTPPELLRYQYSLHQITASDTLPVTGGITDQTTLTFNPLHDGRYVFRVAAIDTSSRGGLGTISQVGKLAYVFAGPTASPGNVWQMVSPSRKLEQFSSYLANNEILAVKSWKNEEYADVSPKNIKYGKGYWIITNRNRVYNWDNMEFLQQDTTITVNLAIGWNQIGNPWAWNISMDSCRIITTDNRILNYDTALEEGLVLSELYYNDVIPLRRYVRVLDNILMPKYGYWIYANQPVRIRYDSSPGSINTAEMLPVESIAKSAKNMDLLINLKAQSGKFADSENFFGVCENLNTYDRIYQSALEPPVMSDYLYLYNLENDTRWSGTLKQHNSETEEWDIRLERGSLDKETILSWDWVKSSDENHLFLYHLETAQWFDMSEQDSYTFDNKKRINHFKLYASEDENFEPEVLPVKFALSQNYPNPFNMQTTIELAIPYFADKHQAKLIVYDILGRQVKTLHSGPIASGRIRIHWDGKNDAGVVLASGLYIFRLTSDDFSASKKMILIK